MSSDTDRGPLMAADRTMSVSAHGEVMTHLVPHPARPWLTARAGGV